MSKFKQIKLAGIKTISIKKRKSKVSPKDFARVIDPKTARMSEFIDSLPHILAASELRDLVQDIVLSRRKKKPVILMMGAHVIKVGLSPLVIDLVHRGIVTHVAMNSAASIHDVETAMWGQTSEDVAVNIMDVQFGMSRETGNFINLELTRACNETTDGYGEALAKKIIGSRAPYESVSILAACYKHGVPVTVHAAIGTDIIHQQPTMDGAATGEMSFRDFKVLAETIKNLKGGGVVLNVGSAVILPEVFLKALTVARNLGHKAQGFSTANFDMIRQYRPQVNVVERPTQRHGRGYNFTGHHELLIPLLAAMIKLHRNKG
jgi:deoxyhypusine synthase